ncbi:MAG: nicotinate-nucleotide adenylyltransferase [Spirulina sp. SIO3F2]|nr:nicotinate-nucleotide adenylyltransferase [Spirulina sp. SIO3F2]
MNNLALFGTSADPPTAGHQSILRWLANHYDYVAVWAADNPMKSGQTPLAHRMAMLCLVVQALQAEYPNLRLHPELSDARTLNTIERAQAHWGQDWAMTFVIGSDLLPQLPHWYRIQELLNRIELLVIPRPGYPITMGDRIQLTQLGARHTIADLTPPAVSSSRYRKRGDRTVVHPEVAAYIDAQHLYVRS